jgi:hypothetical protein
MLINSIAVSCAASSAVQMHIINITKPLNPRQFFNCLFRRHQICQILILFSLNLFFIFIILVVGPQDTEWIFIKFAALGRIILMLALSRSVEAWNFGRDFFS